MSIPDLKSRMSSLDSFFLYHEKKESPLHVGAVSIFEGELSIEELIRTVDSRIHLLPRYQQIIVSDPLNIGHPTWEADSNFDARKHISHVRLEEPGTEEQLSVLASELMSQLLDRSKPLWDVVLVTGLAGNRSAMISRIHHCMVDGVSGVDLMKILFDLTPDPPPLPARWDPPPPPAPREPARRIFDAVIGGLQEVMHRVVDIQNGLLTLTQSLVNQQSRAAAQSMSGEFPRLLSPVNMLPFNGPHSGQRHFIWMKLSFAEARAIRGALQGSVNDVVLSILAGAVSKYVQLHGQPVAGRHVRMMVPFNLRQDHHQGTMGNVISVLPVEIPLDKVDAVERFRYINHTTTIMKQGRMAEVVNLFLSMFGTIPAPLQSVFGALLNTPLPPFNMIATNVPGPQIPLYSLGHRLLAHYPFVPIAYAIGFGVAIMSYDQHLFLGLTADAQALPDVERMREYIYEAFTELRQAAGVAPIEAHPLTAPPTRNRNQETTSATA